MINDTDDGQTQYCQFQNECIEYKDISYLKIMPICAIHELSIACHDKVNKCKYYKLYKQLQRLKAEFEQYKKSKQVSYEAMQTEWNKAINTLRDVEAENKLLKGVIKDINIVAVVEEKEELRKWYQEEKKSNEKLQKIYQDEHCNNLKYKKALEEIREDMQEDTTCESRECGCDDYAECINCLKETIINKINEVLEENEIE